MPMPSAPTFRIVVALALLCTLAVIVSDIVVLIQLRNGCAADLGGVRQWIFYDTCGAARNSIFLDTIVQALLFLVAGSLLWFGNKQPERIPALARTAVLIVALAVAVRVGFATVLNEQNPPVLK